MTEACKYVTKWWGNKKRSDPLCQQGMMFCLLQVPTYHLTDVQKCHFHFIHTRGMGKGKDISGLCMGEAGDASVILQQCWEAMFSPTATSVHVSCLISHTVTAFSVLMKCSGQHKPIRDGPSATKEWSLLVTNKQGQKRTYWYPQCLTQRYSCSTAGSRGWRTPLYFKKCPQFSASCCPTTFTLSHTWV